MPSLGNDDKNDKASQKSEENQGWYLENDNENDKMNETLCLTSLVFVCFYRKGCYDCNEDHCGICMIFRC